MVNGLDSFISQFRDFSDCYTVIGGAACDILMTEAGLKFRATKDVDMILILETQDRFTEFAEQLWEYIRQGGYTYGWKNSDEVHFYRFTNPSRPGYPVQLELFSRMPGYHLEAPAEIIPIHIDDQVSSLSAILLDDEYYNFMRQGRKQERGVTVLGPEYLIPFKMYAWLNLTQQKTQGRHVNEKDLRKHKLDVFRLLQIIPASSRINVSEGIRQHIAQFLTAMEQEEIALNQIQIPIRKGDALEILRNIYLH